MPTDKTPSSPSPISSATVLVVDDNKDAVDIVARLLSHNGIPTLRAYSGHECLDIVRTHAVDVIVLDVMMPEMDGLEVCKRLKELPSSPPVILLTAKDDMATRAAGMSLGVSEFMVKPVNTRDLLARIKTQLNTLQWVRDIDKTSEIIDPLRKP
ncbi:MAG: response regulator [Deltaproteobacteria bacterium]|nr:response regulator [Deltaproteobacteria bacterium]